MIDNETFRKGIRDDGTVEGYAVETHYLPCKAVGDDIGFMRVLVDDNSTDVETRIPHSALMAAGWIKSPTAHLSAYEDAVSTGNEGVTQEQINAGPHAGLGNVPSDYTLGAAPTAQPPSDEQIDEIAERQTWHDGDSPRLDHRRFARELLAAHGLEGRTPTLGNGGNFNPGPTYAKPPAPAAPPPVAASAAEAARVLAEFAKTAPGRLPQRVQDAIAVALADGAAVVPEGYEKMRGGKPVAYWRDNALEAAAQIAEAYHSNPGVAADIRAMKSTPGVEASDAAPKRKSGADGRES